MIRVAILIVASGYLTGGCSGSASSDQGGGAPALTGSSGSLSPSSVTGPGAASSSGGNSANANSAGGGSSNGAAPSRTDSTVQSLATQAAPSATDLEAIVTADASNAKADTIYVSIAHLANPAGGTNDLEVYRFGITKALNSLSVKPALVKLTALDPAETVYRVNLSDFSLTTSNLSAIEAVAGAATNVSKVANSSVIKGDWLVYAVTRPEVYDGIMQLPNFIGATSSFGLPTLEGALGVDRTKSIYIVAPNSEVTFSTRVLERTPITAGGQSDGYYWRTYDFLSSADPAAIAAGQQSPAALSSAVASNGQLVAGEMFFSLPNGMQASMLSGFQQQHRIDAQALVATDHYRSEDGVAHCVGGVANCGYVINGESCMVCHAAGIKINPKPSGFFNTTLAEATTLLQGDQARYVKALTAMGFATVSAEPVGATLARYRTGNSVQDNRQQGSEVNPVTNLLTVFQR